LLTTVPSVSDVPLFLPAAGGGANNDMKSKSWSETLKNDESEIDQMLKLLG